MTRTASDRIFFSIVLSLTFAGIAIFSSAALGQLARETGSVSRNIFLQTGLGLGLGSVAFLLARFTPLAAIKRHAMLIYLFTLCLTALVFVPGIGFHAGGATRWLSVGFTTVQPAELLKIGFVIALAAWLSSRARLLTQCRKGLVPFSVLLALPAGILLAQPNTSTTMLLVCTAMVMYFAAGAPLRDFGILLACGVIGLGSIIFIRPYVMDRIMTFIHPSADALGSGYQIQQSLIAIGSGGIAGRGFGQSVEKFNYLPEPDGDSVFAVFAEETGFMGSSLLVILFLVFAARGMVIASHARDMFGAQLALGFSFLIFFQALVNMCAMLGIIPLTGLPLPFISHGGTALMAVLGMCGIILNVAAHKSA